MTKHDNDYYTLCETLGFPAPCKTLWPHATKTLTECVKAVSTIKCFLFQKWRSYLINNTCLIIYFWIYSPKINKGVTEMRGVLRKWASKSNKDRWCVWREAGGGRNGEWCLEERKEKDTAEELLGRREEEKKKSNVKRNISETSVIISLVSVTKADVLPLCAHLWASLKLLRKRVVPWKLGLGL